VTQVLILMLAGNLASQLAKTVQQGGWINHLADGAWDSESLLPMDHPVATVLHGVMGYESNPSQLQVLAYGLTVVGIAAAVHWVNARKTTQASRAGLMKAA
jgi:high-affinity iron transporter